jgi:hypothetical protein
LADSFLSWHAWSSVVYLLSNRSFGQLLGGQFQEKEKVDFVNLTVTRSSLIAIGLVLSLVLLTGVGSASASNSLPETRLMCTRSSWANTDKCKDLAVANKNAPKDLKKEIERLASLTATSYQQMKIEQVKMDAIYQKEMSKYTLEKAKVERQNLITQEACFKRLGRKFNPLNYSNNWPSKCMALYDLGPSEPYRWVGGASRKIWAQAWLDLSTLAKTFPQHIQPDKLSLLINAYESSRACVSNTSCVPPGL